ncbi:cytochrome P450 [Mycobacterium triplex]|uniref:Cytochrome P450 family protein n=1 Tax=Mycobacterium triplex TaxID=47839 RepID=A0A024JSC8_9MYCO|nr:cytochrome P450 [Mycobacterium triplex]CDO86705.1 cytochrome P450 family protein [Mycobacterium triplex]
MAIGALPPGPRLPVSVQTAAWMTNPWRFMERSAARFGDTFTLRLAGEGTWVMVSHPDAVKEVFTGPPELLRGGEANRILLPVVGANSVLLLDGEAHKEQRQLLVPPFRGNHLQSYADTMTAIAENEIARWPRGEPVLVRTRMQALTLEVILRAVFGLSEGGRLDQLRMELVRMLTTTTGSPGRLLLLVLSPQRVRAALTRKLFRDVDRLLYAEIDDRRRTDDLDERADVLSMLLRARHADGRPLSDVEIRDELMTLLLAGHESTASALASAVEWVVGDPDVQSRLVDEVHAGGYEFLDAIVMETLRLRPVFSLVPRLLKAPMEIGGVPLPAGVTVVPSIYLMHRRPDIYPDPQHFRPARFLEQRAGTYTWIPFGGGVRRCLGAAFAQYEMRVVLATLFRHCRVQPVGEQAEREPGASLALGWRPVPEPCRLRVCIER